MKWDLPGKWPTASSSWTRGKSSRRTRQRSSSTTRSTRGPSCFSARSCAENRSHLLVRHVDLGPLLQPFRHRQFLAAHEIRIEQLGLIAVAGIAEDGDDGLARPELLGKANGAGDIDTGRATQAKAFVLKQLIDHSYGFLVRDQEGIVDLGRLDDRRDAPEPDAFGDRAARRRFRGTVLEQLIHCRSMRVGAGDDDVLVFLLQTPTDAGERAAGADRADEGVDLAACLFPNLGTGRFVVRLGIVEIVPLIGE